MGKKKVLLLSSFARMLQERIMWPECPKENLLRNRLRRGWCITQQPEEEEDGFITDFYRTSFQEKFPRRPSVRPWEPITFFFFFFYPKEKKQHPLWMPDESQIVETKESDANPPPVNF
jgi:hypothetical protein